MSAKIEAYYRRWKKIYFHLSINYRICGAIIDSARWLSNKDQLQWQIYDAPNDFQDFHEHERKNFNLTLQKAWVTLPRSGIGSHAVQLFVLILKEIVPAKGNVVTFFFHVCQHPGEYIGNNMKEFVMVKGYFGDIIS